VRSLVAASTSDTPSAIGLRDRVLELSPQWLARTDHGSLLDRTSRVLKAISAAIEAEQDPARRESLRVVSSAYREAARHGFSPLVCHKELIQVGMQAEGDQLKPIQVMRSKTIDEFCREVQPDRIVQINVLKGSANSEFFDKPPSSVLQGSSDQDTSSSQSENVVSQNGE